MGYLSTLMTTKASVMPEKAFSTANLGDSFKQQTAHEIYTHTFATECVIADQ